MAANLGRFILRSYVTLSVFPNNCIFFRLASHRRLSCSDILIHTKTSPRLQCLIGPNPKSRKRAKSPKRKERVESKRGGWCQSFT
jgi:hypothetical protein